MLLVLGALLWCVAGAAPPVRFAAAMLQHGQATPQWPPPSGFVYTWHEGLGQLTRSGIAEAFAAGQRLKARYGADASRMTVFAADQCRALQSAEAVVRGALGEQEELAHLPVHGAVADMLDGWQQCPTLGELRTQLHGSPEWGNLTEDGQYINARVYLAKQLRLTASLDSWEPVASYMRLAPPANLSQSMVKQVVEIGRTVRALPFVEESSGAMMASLTAGIVMYDVLQRMKKSAAAASDNATELVVYVGHVENLLGLLRVLEGDNGDAFRLAPLPGAALFLELDTAGAVRVVYEGAALSVGDPCPDDGCPLETFRHRFQLYDDDAFVSTYWPSICDRDLSGVCPHAPSGTDAFISFIPLWVVASALGGFVVAVVLLLVGWRWWRNQQRRTRSQAVLEIEIN